MAPVGLGVGPDGTCGCCDGKRQRVTLLPREGTPSRAASRFREIVGAVGGDMALVADGLYGVLAMFSLHPG